MCTRTHTHGAAHSSCTDEMSLLLQAHTHKLKQTYLFVASPLPFTVPPTACSCFLFLLATFVSISCDIPFDFLITFLFSVLQELNNFTHHGHKPIHSLSRPSDGTQIQLDDVRIHTVGKIINK